MDGSRDAVKRLFFAALERPRGDRAAFLMSADVEADLRQQVEELLDAHEQVGSFLEAPPASDVLHEPSLCPGTRLGPYEIAELIGRGGMGEVYRARDVRLGRQVAIKVLLRAFAGDQARQHRFEAEARAASALNHPNVLTVYDVGALDSTDGSAFLVMELLDGETLRSRLRREPRLSRELAIEYGLQVARGLAAAHAAGIIHRDLKPENLFITNDGRLKILDFGLAKSDRLDGLTRTGTQPGVVLGSAGYMSPEQVRGQPADARSDIFAYGTVLFEMITGHRAFAGDSSIDTLTEILHADPFARQRVASTPDAALLKIVRRCIAKDPGDRYQSATDVVAALEVAAGERSHGHTLRLSVAAIGVSLVLCVAAGGIAWKLRSDTRATTSSAETSHQELFAVLPFENISADQSQQYFANGMTEEINAQLARLPSLRLMSRAAVAQYVGAPDAARRMRQELGVTILLTGSVRVAGPRARITVQLVDVENNQAIWAEQYDEDLQDILQVQSDVATAIATALKVQLSADERKRLAQPSTKNAAAYELYLQASEMSANERRNLEHIRMLKEAVQLDPQFAAAYALLAGKLGQRGDFGDRQFFAEALDAARKAIEADPNEARAHHALAVAQMRLGRFSHARVSFLRALDLAPNFSRAAFDLSVSDSLIGHLDEALLWARRGFTLAPNVPYAYYHVGAVLLQLADDQAAERWLRAAEERLPRTPRIQILLSIWEFLTGTERAADVRIRRALNGHPDDQELQLAVAELALLVGSDDTPGRLERLFKQAPEAHAFMQPQTFRTLYAYILMKQGDTRLATKLLHEAMGAAQKQLAEGNESPEVPMEIAAIHAVLGEREKALRWIGAGYRSGWRLYREMSRDPFFSSLRNDPEFLRIRQRIQADVAAMRQRVDVNDNPRMPPIVRHRQ
jgi:serine/threonine protein kinase/tetratricopeptide (TPR) repeat protein